MPFSVRILRFFGILLLGVCALGVAGITWAYLIEPNLLFVRQVDYRIPQWNGRGRPLKIVVAGDFHFMPTPFDEVRAQRYVQRIMQLKPDLVLYLDVPVEFTAQLMRHREAETNTHADIHEQDLAYLRTCREMGRYAADYYGWKRIRCVENGALRSIEAIHEEIYALVAACLEES